MPYLSQRRRWLVYSNARQRHVRQSQQQQHPIWDATYASLSPANVTASGNAYIFAYQPTLTFTSTGSLTKTYGQDATALVGASPYTVSGFQGGVTARSSGWSCKRL